MGESMIFNNDKYNIYVDSFSREYEMTDRCRGTVVEKSNSYIQIRDVDEYMSFVNNINYISNVYYNITKICNLRCSYCYSNNGSSFVSIEENRTILDKLQKLNTRSITLIGGEPLCHPYINEVLAEILSRDFEEICIVTNGTRVQLIDVNYLKDPRVYLQISLDGYNEETNAPTRGKNTFEKVINNIDYLIKNNVTLRVMKVVTRSNIETSIDFFEYFYKKGIIPGFFMVKQVDDGKKPTIHQIEQLIMKLFEYVNKPESIFEIFKFADNLMFDSTGFPIAHCGAGIITLSINPDGNVYPCVKRSEEIDLITNLLHENSIQEIEANRKRIIEKELVFSKKECLECDICYFCGGGCRAEEHNGQICEYNCEYFKMAVDIYYKLKLMETTQSI